MPNERSTRVGPTIGAFLNLTYYADVPFSIRDASDDLVLPVVVADISRFFSV